MTEPCRCERADAITSLVAISRIVEKVSIERDELRLEVALLKSEVADFERLLNPKGKP